jgi:hypothetical protein
MEAAPMIQVFSTLPLIQYVGEAGWSRVREPSPLVIDRAILAEGCFAVPIPEAMVDSGIDSPHPILLEDFNGPDAPRHLMEAGAADSTEFWSTLALADSDVQIDWYFAVYNAPYISDGSKDHDLMPWFNHQLNHVESLVTSTQLRAAMLWVPSRTPSGLRQLKQRSPSLPGGWSLVIKTVPNAQHGGCIETVHEVILLLPKEVAEQLKSLEMPPNQQSTAMARCLDDDHGWVSDALVLEDLDIIRPSESQRQVLGEAPGSPRAARTVNLQSAPSPVGGYPAYDPEAPAPSIYRPRAEEDFFNGPFGIWYERDGAVVCRPVRLPEVFRMLGIEDARARPWLLLPPDLVVTRARAAPGVSAIAFIIQLVHAAEQQAEIKQGKVPVLVSDPTPASVLPLPTHQQWKDATTADHDLAVICQALQRGQPLQLADLSDKRYFEPFQAGQFDLEEGILYCYERSKIARVRQLRTRVVPIALRRVVVVACHSSPFGGHSGFTRTLYRIQARYWWPGMTRDIREGVVGCAHCNLANTVSHEAQLKLNTLACDGPFDVVFIDFWSPGDIVDKQGNIKVLTYLDGMTSFAMASFVQQGQVDSAMVADMCVSHFFATVGLPRLVFVDADSLFKDMFLKTFQLLRIPCQAVAPENHKAVRNENFHRYLNKVERINSADTASLWRWKQGVLFACYAWNSSPIDGTDVPRSQVAIGRQFPFPIDLSPALPRSTNQEGQHALDHYEAASPLLFKQRQLLDILNAERRRRHTEIRNSNAAGMEFQPGDLVIVRKQVKSDASNNFAAKLVFKSKGPYRVIERINPNSYRLQKLPFLRGLGRRGRYVKESAARMTRLPSTLIFHKHADGADTRFCLMRGDIADNALEKWLGVVRRGAYVKAEGDPNWAFEPLASMWSEDLPDGDDDESDDSENEEDDDVNMPPVDVDSEGDESDATVEGPQIPTPQPQPQADPSKLAHPCTSDRKALRSLQRAILDSQDKLVLVRVRDNPTQPATFRLGQVDWNARDPALTERFGIYRIRWWRQHLEDATSRSIVDSRFWPDVWTLKANGNFGHVHAVRPDRAAAATANDSTLHWRCGDVSLAEDLIVGPFNFSQVRKPMQGPKRRAVSEYNRVDEMFWNLLSARAHQFGIDVSRIRLPPLDRTG